MPPCLDLHEEIGALHRLLGATVAYCELLERGRAAAVRLADAGEEGAGYLVDSVGTALDVAASEMGTPVQLHHALTTMLRHDAAADRPADGDG